MTEFNDMYTEQYWCDLIEVIIQRVGVEQFVRMTIHILYKLGYQELVKELMSDQVELLDRVTRVLEGTKQ